MIQHLFKIIWNERKSNSWIVLEYIVVFCILWFCCDYMSFLIRSAMYPLGFDIENTYGVRIGKKSITDNQQTEEMDKSEIIQTFITRIKQYPGVEHVAIARSGLPYGRSISTSNYMHKADSVNIPTRLRWVTSGFFDVYKVRLTAGRFFNWEDNAEGNKIVISPDRDGFFKGDEGPNYKLSDIRSLYSEHEDLDYEVVGYAEAVKDTYHERYMNNIFFPFKVENIDLVRHQMAIRVSPNAGKDFADRFVQDMREQLNIGPYFLITLVPSEEMKEEVLNGYGVTNNLNSVYAITAFLIINIFLGIIGTFWHRTQARRGEIGLRISLGASQKNVQWMLYMETLLLLFIASLVAVNICINIAQTDLLEAIDIPKANRGYVGMGIEQDFLNYGCTFLFLSVVSLIAVWYPARQSSRTPPAEALKEE